LVEPEKLLAIKNMRVKLPEIDGFKGTLFPFQQTGVAYLYVAERAHLFDSCGLGKTVQAAALLQLLKNRDEMGKALIVVPPQTMNQWGRELRRFTSLDVAVANGTKVQRVSLYGGMYDVLVTSYPLLLRDEEYLRELRLDVLVLDEEAYFRRSTTKTAKAILRLTRRGQGISRIIGMTATPIQNTLIDMHTLFQAIKRESVLGNKAYFRRRYVREKMIDGVSKNGRPFSFPILLGYQNVADLKRRIAPYYLRRTLKDVEVQLPTLTVVDKWVELSTKQRAAYDGDRKSFSKEAKSMDTTTLLGSLHRLQMIADTLYHVADEDVSSKLDLLMELLNGDLAGQKVIVYTRYRKTVEAVEKRLSAAKIGHVTFMGGTSRDYKDAIVEQFWDDPDTLVCIGTSALEMSLNLQASAHIVALNQMYNPTRVEQLVGRIRRLGSEHTKVVLINIMAKGTLEDKIPELLSKKAALSDAMFDEKGDIFKALTKKELVALLGG